MDDSALKRTGSFAIPDDQIRISAEQLPEGITDKNEWELILMRQSAKNKSGELVEDVLENTQGIVDEYSSIALDVLGKLGNFPENEIPPSSVELDMPNAPNVGSLAINKPEKPEYDTPEVGEAPGLRGDIQTPVMQGVDRPEIVYPDEPTEVLNWEELPYLSDLLDNIKAGINDIVLNGGTGLDSGWEDAVKERALANLDLAHEEKYTEAENYFAAKGHVAPPGGLVSRLDMLNREKLRSEELIISDIVAKQYEIAHEHRKFCLDLGQRIEGLTLAEKKAVEDRALDAAKSTITLLYEKYRTAMEGIRNKVEIYKADIQAESTRVESISSANKSLTDTLSAETSAWLGRLNAEFSLIESIVKMYVAEVGGYGEEVRAEATRVAAIVDSYKAQVGAAEVQGQISLGEYEQLVRAILGEIELRLSSQREAGRISSQVAASALSAFNASASISDGTSRSRSYGESKSMSTSNSYARSIGNSLAMSYGFNESASDNYSESKSYNYSGVAP